MASDVSEGSAMTLAGSSEWISKALYYITNSILYYREVYPEEMFKTKLKHGSNMLILEDARVSSYLKTVIPQLFNWMERDQLRRVVLPILEEASGEVVERWMFDIRVEEGAREAGFVGKSKPGALIGSELSSFVQQMSACASWLPRLRSRRLTFKLLAFCHPETASVSGWREGGGDHGITHRAHTFTMKHIDTTVHGLHGYLAYTPLAEQDDDDTVSWDDTQTLPIPHLAGRQQHDPYN